MITFEIDGNEYTASISRTELPNSIPFTTPEGVTYWLQSPVVAE